MLMLPLIFVQFLKDSMFVELTVITLVSSPAPSPLHTAEGKKQKTAAYIAEQTYLFFCKAKLLSIYHLLTYCIHFHCRCAGVYPIANQVGIHLEQIQQVPLTYTHGQEFWLSNQFNVHELGPWREAKVAGKSPTQTQGEHTGVTEPRIRARAFSLWGKNCSSWIIIIYWELYNKSTISVAVWGLLSCTV